ncbi:unnamed protein product [Protopolystoma xenopodis]|uniref:Uncharacterized protein n=1 Tax=Protopolystoma xenopodis TaxID=117903 RepID=A0A3S5CS33_9PLAT|nr:unnamed protein product [Protopolystoma xenopodis]
MESDALTSDVRASSNATGITFHPTTGDTTFSAHSFFPSSTITYNTLSNTDALANPVSMDVRQFSNPGTGAVTSLTVSSCSPGMDEDTNGSSYSLSYESHHAVSQF